MYKSFVAVISSLTLCFALFACQQDDPGAPPGYVGATEAYLKHFGEPPQGKEGRAYARVGYLPIKSEPGKVRALPIFLFTEEDHVPKILKRLAGNELLLPDDSPLYKPFPDDLEIVAKPAVDGTQELSLHAQQSWSNEDQAAAGSALAETSLQFPEVDKVVITFNDKPLTGMPTGGYLHNSQIMAAVDPPELVLVAGAWEEGGSIVVELLVEFDRPIKVNRFQLFDDAGNEIEGEYYTSIFQMAVIVHPEEPQKFMPGQRLRAEWDVVDMLGRTNSGTDVLPLHHYEH